MGRGLRLGLAGGWRGVLSKNQKLEKINTHIRYLQMVRDGFVVEVVRVVSDAFATVPRMRAAEVLLYVIFGKIDFTRMLCGRAGTLQPSW